MSKEENLGKESIEESKESNDIETVSKFAWVLIPIAIGGFISMFSNFKQDIQIIIWAVMFLIAVCGLWANNAKKLRRVREKVEEGRWSTLNQNLDNRFDKVEQRFDEVDRRFDVSEKTDRALLRNEIVKAHREWVEKKGFITLEALEYLGKIHDAYNAVGGNDSGDKMWEDIKRLPIDEKQRQQR